MQLSKVRTTSISSKTGMDGSMDSKDYNSGDMDKSDLIEEDLMEQLNIKKPMTKQGGS